MTVIELIEQLSEFPEDAIVDVAIFYEAGGAEICDIEKVFPNGKCAQLSVTSSS